MRHSTGQRNLPVFFLAMALLLSAPQGALSRQHVSRDREFVAAFAATSIRLNPLNSYTATEAQVYTALYEGLTGYHPRTLEPIPAVAERWEISEDGTIYTFHLREEARYWNGDPVKASHFRDTWLAMIDPSQDRAYSFLFDVIAGVREYRQADEPDPESVGIYARDARTLEVHLHSRAPHFVRVLAHHAFTPLHPQVRYLHEPAPEEALGNGPYRIISRTPEEMRLERNSHYWEASRVAIPRLRLIFTDDPPEEVTSRFNDGKIDWVSSGMSLANVADQPSIVVNPLFATTYYFLRADTPPFSNPSVRRALALLLPWERIRDPSIHFMPSSRLVPAIPHYPFQEGISAPDHDEAMTLLAEAGHPRGETLPEITLHIPRGPESTRVAELMKNAWEEALDTTVSLAYTPYPDYFEALREQTYTVGMISWIGDFADPLTFLKMWISSSSLNDARFSDPRFDQLIDESLSQTGAERYKTMAQAEKILLQTGTVLPVSHSPAINLIDRDALEGWYPNPLDIHPFKHLSFAERQPLPGLIRFP
ncbi:peptide ABC transporter substrate-binding protein [Alkalispirochaeta americana]|nr:peptide ABC transporter substrate-binding protein [Alkalispirochaeta americana]